MPVAPPVFRRKGFARLIVEHVLSDKRRGSSTKRGYGWKWQQARTQFLAEHPLCRHCSERDRVVGATVVDHIVPHRGDQRLFWDRKNWQALCKPCHDKKTGSGQ
jgi:5-methylcytosine-specific restriction protein A